MARISLGSHASDGLRSGPIYSQLVNTTSQPNQPFVSYDNFSKYGPGILLSPQNTYIIFPKPPNTPGGFNDTNNIVAPIRPTAAGYLTLRADNWVTFANVGADGMPLIQFDWPRVPTVTVSGVQAGVAANIYVTILGYDWYGFPLQHTYTIGGETVLPRTYPFIVDGAGANDGAIINPETSEDMPVKAFYQISQVYISGGIADGSTVSVGASDIFGLPYVVPSKGLITAINWGTQTDAPYPNPNPIIPTSELTTRVLGSPQTTVGVFVPTDFSQPTATTGDVRGLYAPSSPSSIITVDGQDVAVKTLVFTSYIIGMDTWLNQANNLQQNYMEQNKTNIPNGFPVPSLSPFLAYGGPQYYTGVPQG